MKAISVPCFILMIFCITLISISTSSSLCADAAGVGTVEGAMGVLQRMIPSHAEFFHFDIDPQLTAASKARAGAPLPNTTYDIFAVAASNGHVYINGSSAVALTSGAYWYLKNVTKCQVTWGNNGTGDQLHLPSVLPGVEHTVIESAVPWRYAWNVCTFSYSGVWWTPERWQREIDWMAFHGVNMPLAFTGLEYIWWKVFQKHYNVSLEELGEWFTGPAFLTWQRFGNIQQFTGPLSEGWLIGQRDLQRGILKQMRSLGMTAILPCFAGHLPQIAKELWPTASITRSADWNNFPLNMSYVYFLDPTDPLYQELGAVFLREVIAEYGSDGYFNCDTYNELDPASSNHTFLRHAGSAVVNAIRTVEPNGIWVMQGWLFHSGFWNDHPDRVEAYLGGIANDSMLVLDLNSEAGTLAKKFDQYFGKPWIWNMLHNYGGVRGVYGNMTRIATGPMEDLQREGSTMIGIGFTPEAIEQNPVMYELLTATFWRSEPFDPLPWLKDYVTQRYGNESAQAWKAWQTLFAAVYNQPGEPRSDIEWVPQWQTASFGWENGDPALMIQAAEQYLAAAGTVPSPSTNGPYQYDLVDITRQATTMFFSDVHRMLDNAAYSSSNNTDTLIRIAHLMTGLISDLDGLLGTNLNYLLGTWTHGAMSWTDGSKEERAQYMYGAKNQITMWGPSAQICDYAAKAWQGLYSGYYLQRWSFFLDKLIQDRKEGNLWNEGNYNTEMKSIEETWDSGMTQYSNNTLGNGTDALAIAQGLLNTITTPLGSGPDYEFESFKGIDMYGSNYFAGNPMWTQDVRQLGILCSLLDSCVGFNSWSEMKSGEGTFVWDNGNTLYIRRSNTQLIAKAKKFMKKPHSTVEKKDDESGEDRTKASKATEKSQGNLLNSLTGGTETHKEKRHHPRSAVNVVGSRAMQEQGHHEGRERGPHWNLADAHPYSKPENRIVGDQLNHRGHRRPTQERSTSYVYSHSSSTRERKMKPAKLTEVAAATVSHGASSLEGSPRRRRASSVSFSTGSPMSPKSQTGVSFGSGSNNLTSPKLEPKGSPGSFRNNAYIKSDRKTYYKGISVVDFGSEKSEEGSPKKEDPEKKERKDNEKEQAELDTPLGLHMIQQDPSVTPPRSPNEGSTLSGLQHAALRCPQLGAITMALNYLLWCDRPTSLVKEKVCARLLPQQVTVEQLFSKVCLPLRFATENQLTIHLLHEIVTQFVEGDERFNGCTIDLCVFDVLRLEDNALSRDVSDASPRQLACTLSDFRSELQADATTRDRVKIVCYDPLFLAARNQEDEEEEEEGEDCLNFTAQALCGSIVSPMIQAEKKNATELTQPHHKTQTAVVVDLHPGSQMVELALPTYHGSNPSSEAEYGSHLTEVPLHALHRAVAARCPASGRAHGYISVCKRGFTLSPSSGASPVVVTESVTTPQWHSSDDEEESSLTKQERSLREMQPQVKPNPIFPFTPLSLDDIEPGMGNHLIAVSYGLHVLRYGNRTPYTSHMKQEYSEQSGGESSAECAPLATKSLVHALSLPSEYVCRSPLRVDQVYSYTKAYLEQIGSKTTVAFLPLLRKRHSKGAPCSVSVTQLGELLLKVAEINRVGTTAQSTRVLANGFATPPRRNSDDTPEKEQGGRPPENPQVVLLFCHDPNSLHSTVNIATDGPNWTVFNGYSEASHATLLIETQPATYGRTSYVPLEDLHTAMVGNGLILLGAEGVQLESILPVTNDSIVRAYQEDFRSYVPHPLQQITFPTRQKAPIVLAALALSQLGIPTTLSDILREAPCNPSCYLSADMSMQDFARCVNFYLKGKDDLAAQCFFPSQSASRMASVAFLSTVNSALEEKSQVIANFTRDMLPTAPPLTVNSALGYAGDFLLVTGFTDDTNTQLTVVDANPEPCHRVWAATALELFKASQDVCPLSRRHRGLIVIGKNPEVARMYKLLADEEKEEGGIGNGSKIVGWPANPISLPISHPFRPTLFPISNAYAMCLTALGLPTTSETLLYGASRSGRTYDTGVLSQGRRVIGLDSAFDLMERFLKTTSDAEKDTIAEIPVASCTCRKRYNRIRVQKHTTESFDWSKADWTNPRKRYVALYDVKRAHLAPQSYTGFACPYPLPPNKGDDTGSDTFMMVDADPSTWGAAWSITAKERLEKDFIFGVIELEHRLEPKPPQSP